MSFLDALYADHIHDTSRPQDLDPASTPAPRRVAEIQETITQYEALRAQLTEDLQRIDQDPDRSPEYIVRARAARLEQWQAEAQAIVDRAFMLTRTLLRSREEASTPRSPVADPAVLEARLGNARSDVSMILAAVPTGGIIEAMERTVRTTQDPAIRYLLLGTPYPESYLASRGIPGAVQDWRRARLELLPLVLDDAGRRALEELRVLRDIAQTPAYLEALHAYHRTNMGL